jgi:NADH-quinone oxidoreductase subunit N
VIVGIVFAVIGAFYYLRVIRAMYFDEPEFSDGREPMTQRGDLSLRVVFAVNALSLLVLGLGWNPIMAWCQKAFA